MRKKIYGFFLIEFIVAVSLFAIIGGGAVAVILGSLSSSRLASEQTTASNLAAEGIEAVKSIKNQSWSAVTNGPHGISNAGNVWSFSGTSDVTPPFTRVITVSDVNRLGGAIVTSGGTLDPETKKVVSTVSWNFTPTRTNSVVLTSYLTNWQMTKATGTTSSSCLLQADCLTVDTTNVAFNPNNRRILNITLGNSDPVNAISITKMRVTWTGHTTRRMTTIQINGSFVWFGSVASGVQVSIATTPLPVGTTAMPIDYIGFDGNMNGSVFSIEFTMLDNSTKTVTGITP